MSHKMRDFVHEVSVVVFAPSEVHIYTGQSRVHLVWHRVKLDYYELSK